MDIWTLLSRGAWLLSVAIFAWILADALKVRRDYDDEFLMSSSEGEE